MASAFKPPVDKELSAYVDEVREALRLQPAKAQAIGLARYGKCYK
jgi:hypothetical protein